VFEGSAKKLNLLIISRWIEMGTFLQDTLSGDVIDLKTYPCRIFEQDGIISRGPRPLLRRMHDTDIQLLQKQIEAIDVLPAPTPETHVM
jgi:hypothetical protein